MKHHRTKLPPVVPVYRDKRPIIVSFHYYYLHCYYRLGIVTVFRRVGVLKSIGTRRIGLTGEIDVEQLLWHPLTLFLYLRTNSLFKFQDSFNDLFQNKLTSKIRQKDPRSFAIVKIKMPQRFRDS